MAGINKTELWKELEATNEGFVRQKHAAAGYSPAKQKLVGQWIAKRDAEVQAAKAAADAEAGRSSALWTKVAALATSASVIATLIVAAWPKK